MIKPKDTILEMKNFLELVKNGTKIAKQLGKDYIFYSSYPISTIIQNWLQQNSIKFQKIKTSYS